RPTHGEKFLDEPVCVIRLGVVEGQRGSPTGPPRAGSVNQKYARCTEGTVPGGHAGQVGQHASA
ncbi:hypothetical protein ACW9HQ_51420, partial [Nocardia gipuzkoensis]